MTHLTFLFGKAAQLVVRLRASETAHHGDLEVNASFGKRLALPRQRCETEKIIDGAAAPDFFSL
jgi:hypothetical protein